MDGNPRHVSGQLCRRVQTHPLTSSSWPTGTAIHSLSVSGSAMTYAGVPSTLS